MSKINDEASWASRRVRCFAALAASALLLASLSGDITPIHGPRHLTSLVACRHNDGFFALTSPSWMLLPRRAPFRTAVATSVLSFADAAQPQGNNDETDPAKSDGAGESSGDAGFGAPRTVKYTTRKPRGVRKRKAKTAAAANSPKTDDSSSGHETSTETSTAHQKPAERPRKPRTAPMHASPIRFNGNVKVTRPAPGTPSKPSSTEDKTKELPSQQAPTTGVVPPAQPSSGSEKEQGGAAPKEDGKGKQTKPTAPPTAPPVQYPKGPVLYVSSAKAVDSTGCGPITNPCSTLHAALDIAVPGTEVRVLPGTYTCGYHITFPVSIVGVDSVDVLSYLLTGGTVASFKSRRSDDRSVVSGAVPKDGAIAAAEYSSLFATTGRPVFSCHHTRRGFFFDSVPAVLSNVEVVGGYGAGAGGVLSVLHSDVPLSGHAITDCAFDDCIGLASDEFPQGAAGAVALLHTTTRTATRKHKIDASQLTFSRNVGRGGAHVGGGFGVGFAATPDHSRTETLCPQYVFEPTALTDAETDVRFGGLYTRVAGIPASVFNIPRAESRRRRTPANDTPNSTKTPSSKAKPSRSSSTSAHGGKSPFEKADPLFLNTTSPYLHFLGLDAKGSDAGVPAGATQSSDATSASAAIEEMLYQMPSLYDSAVFDASDEAELHELQEMVAIFFTAETHYRGSEEILVRSPTLTRADVHAAARRQKQSDLRRERFKTDVTRRIDALVHRITSRRETEAVAEFKEAMGVLDPNGGTSQRGPQVGRRKSTPTGKFGVFVKEHERVFGLRRGRSTYSKRKVVMYNTFRFAARPYPQTWRGQHGNETTTRVEMNPFLSGPPSLYRVPLSGGSAGTDSNTSSGGALEKGKRSVTARPYVFTDDVEATTQERRIHSLMKKLQTEPIPANVVLWADQLADFRDLEGAVEERDDDTHNQVPLSVRQSDTSARTTSLTDHRDDVERDRATLWITLAMMPDLDVTERRIVTAAVRRAHMAGALHPLRTAIERMLAAVVTDLDDTGSDLVDKKRNPYLSREMLLSDNMRAVHILLRALRRGGTANTILIGGILNAHAQVQDMVAKFVESHGRLSAKARLQRVFEAAYGPLAEAPEPGSAPKPHLAAWEHVSWLIKCPMTQQWAALTTRSKEEYFETLASPEMAACFNAEFVASQRTLSPADVTAWAPGPGLLKTLESDPQPFGVPPTDGSVHETPQGDATTADKESNPGDVRKGQGASVGNGTARMSLDARIAELKALQGPASFRLRCHRRSPDHMASRPGQGGCSTVTVSSLPSRYGALQGAYSEQVGVSVANRPVFARAHSRRLVTARLMRGGDDELEEGKDYPPASGNTTVSMFYCAAAARWVVAEMTPQQLGLLDRTYADTRASSTAVDLEEAVRSAALSLASGASKPSQGSEKRQSAVASTLAAQCGGVLTSPLTHAVHPLAAAPRGLRNPTVVSAVEKSKGATRKFVALLQEAVRHPRALSPWPMHLKRSLFRAAGAKLRGRNETRELSSMTNEEVMNHVLRLAASVTTLSSAPLAQQFQQSSTRLSSNDAIEGRASHGRVPFELAPLVHHPLAVDLSAAEGGALSSAGEDSDILTDTERVLETEASAFADKRHRGTELHIAALIAQRHAEARADRVRRTRKARMAARRAFLSSIDGQRSGDASSGRDLISSSSSGWTVMVVDDQNVGSELGIVGRASGAVFRCGHRADGRLDGKSVPSQDDSSATVHTDDGIESAASSLSFEERMARLPSDDPRRLNHKGPQAVSKLRRVADRVDMLLHTAPSVFDDAASLIAAVNRQRLDRAVIADKGTPPSVAERLRPKAFVALVNDTAPLRTAAAIVSALVPGSDPLTRTDSSGQLLTEALAMFHGFTPSVAFGQSPRGDMDDPLSTIDGSPLSTAGPGESRCSAFVFNAAPDAATGDYGSDASLSITADENLRYVNQEIAELEAEVWDLAVRLSRAPLHKARLSEIVRSKLSSEKRKRSRIAQLHAYAHALRINRPVATQDFAFDETALQSTSGFSLPTLYGRGLPTLGPMQRYTKRGTYNGAPWFGTSTAANSEHSNGHSDRGSPVHDDGGPHRSSSGSSPHSDPNHPGGGDAANAAKLPSSDQFVVYLRKRVSVVSNLPMDLLIALYASELRQRIDDEAFFLPVVEGMADDTFRRDDGQHVPTHEAGGKQHSAKGQTPNRKRSVVPPLGVSGLDADRVFRSRRCRESDLAHRWVSVRGAKTALDPDATGELLSAKDTLRIAVDHEWVVARGSEPPMLETNDGAEEPTFAFIGELFNFIGDASRGPDEAAPIIETLPKRSLDGVPRRRVTVAEPDIRLMGSVDEVLRARNVKALADVARDKRMRLLERSESAGTTLRDLRERWRALVRGNESADDLRSACPTDYVAPLHPPADVHDQAVMKLPLSEFRSKLLVARTKIVAEVNNEIYEAEESVRADDKARINAEFDANPVPMGPQHSLLWLPRVDTTEQIAVKENNAAVAPSSESAIAGDIRDTDVILRGATVWSSASTSPVLGHGGEAAAKMAAITKLLRAVKQLDSTSDAELESIISAVNDTLARKVGYDYNTRVTDDSTLDLSVVFDSFTVRALRGILATRATVVLDDVHGDGSKPREQKFPPRPRRDGRAFPVGPTFLRPSRHAISHSLERTTDTLKATAPSIPADSKAMHPGFVPAWSGRGLDGATLTCMTDALATCNAVLLPPNVDSSLAGRYHQQEKLFAGRPVFARPLRRAVPGWGSASVAFVFYCRSMRAWAVGPLPIAEDAACRASYRTAITDAPVPFGRGVLWAFGATMDQRLTHPLHVTCAVRSKHASFPGSTFTTADDESNSPSASTTSRKRTVMINTARPKGESCRGATAPFAAAGRPPRGADSLSCFDLEGEGDDVGRRDWGDVVEDNDHTIITADHASPSGPAVAQIRRTSFANNAAHVPASVTGSPTVVAGGACVAFASAPATASLALTVVDSSFGMNEALSPSGKYGDDPQRRQSTHVAGVDLAQAGALVVAGSSDRNILGPRVSVHATRVTAVGNNGPAGAFSMHAADAALFAAEFTDNAGTIGGAVSVSGHSTVAMSQSLCARNVAALDGGCIAGSPAADLFVHRSLMLHNRATTSNKAKGTSVGSAVSARGSATVNESKIRALIGRAVSLSRTQRFLELVGRPGDPHVVGGDGGHSDRSMSMHDECESMLRDEVSRQASSVDVTTDLPSQFQLHLAPYESISLCALALNSSRGSGRNGGGGLVRVSSDTAIAPLSSLELERGGGDRALMAAALKVDDLPSPDVSPWESNRRSTVSCDVLAAAPEVIYPALWSAPPSLTAHQPGNGGDDNEVSWGRVEPEFGPMEALQRLLNRSRFPTQPTVRITAAATSLDESMVDVGIGYVGCRPLPLDPRLAHVTPRPVAAPSVPLALRSGLNPTVTSTAGDRAASTAAAAEAWGRSVVLEPSLEDGQEQRQRRVKVTYVEGTDERDDEFPLQDLLGDDDALFTGKGAVFTLNPPSEEDLLPRGSKPPPSPATSSAVPDGPSTFAVVIDGLVGAFDAGILRPAVTILETAASTMVGFVVTTLRLASVLGDDGDGMTGQAARDEEVMAWLTVWLLVASAVLFGVGIRALKYVQRGMRDPPRRKP